MTNKKLLGVLLPIWLKNKLKEVSDKSGLTQSEIIRNGIIKEIIWIEENLDRG